MQRASIVLALGCALTFFATAAFAQDDDAGGPPPGFDPGQMPGMPPGMVPGKMPKGMKGKAKHSQSSSHSSSHSSSSSTTSSHATPSTHDGPEADASAAGADSEHEDPGANDGNQGGRDDGAASAAFASIQAWVTPGKSRELWLTLKPKFTGVIGRYTLSGPCKLKKEYMEPEDLKKGVAKFFMLSEEGGCGPGEYTIGIDYKKAGSQKVESDTFNVTPGTEFVSGNEVLHSVSAKKGGAGLRFSASVDKAVKIYIMRIYDRDGVRVGACTSMDGVDVADGSTEFDACNSPPRSGSYHVLFWGAEAGDNGGYYFQYLPFDMR